MNLQKCKRPECNVTFQPRENKIWCSTKCKNAFHRAENKTDVNANNREVAKLKKAGRTLRILFKKMEEYKMENISANTLLLFDIPLKAATKTMEHPDTGVRIHIYFDYAIYPIDKTGLNFKIIKR